jgi:hypothetical protein
MTVKELRALWPLPMTMPFLLEKFAGMAIVVPKHAAGMAS